MFNKMKIKEGFTIVEVLLVLGVIGVVAALTIPTLYVHINTAKFRSQYKRTLSNLNQAVKTSEANYDLNFATVAQECATPTDDPKSYATMCGIINGSISDATYYTSSNIPSRAGIGLYAPTGPNMTSDDKGIYLFADGSVFAFDLRMAACSMDTGADIADLKSTCNGFIDVNGTSAPNKEVTCGNTTTMKSKSVGDCVVRENSVDMGDVFPVAIHDGTIEPLTNAARYVLETSILNTKD